MTEFNLKLWIYEILKYYYIAFFEVLFILHLLFHNSNDWCLINSPTGSVNVTFMLLLIWVVYWLNTVVCLQTTFLCSPLLHSFPEPM